VASVHLHQLTDESSTFMAYCLEVLNHFLMKALHIEALLTVGTDDTSV